MTEPVASIAIAPLRDDSCFPTELPPFFATKHVAYIAKLAVDLSSPKSFEGAVTEHLRMSGIYWSLTALHILLPSAAAVNELMGVVSTPSATTSTSNSSEDSGSPQESIVDWLWTCYNESTGSFGGNSGQEGHLLYTLSALQILALSDQLSGRLQVHKARIVDFVVSLQQPDGSFTGDASGEIDTRFTYCALQSLALLGELQRVNIDAAVSYVNKCKNLDGGFGSCIGAESHAGQVFCCVGALAIAGRLDSDNDLLGWWLSERQVDSGGLNGRPEKQADVCYSWWILSALAILGKVAWINTDKLANYILKCQDGDDGGIADRPEDMADVFHTFFGIAGLSLTGHLHQEGLEPKYRCIDPVYALPTDIVQKLKLPGQVVARHEDGVDERLQKFDILYTNT